MVRRFPLRETPIEFRRHDIPTVTLRFSPRFGLRPVARALANS
jgi:hypothetical protein